MATIPRYLDASSSFSTVPSSRKFESCASVKPPSLFVPDLATRNTSHASSPPSSWSLSSGVEPTRLSRMRTTGFLPWMNRENRAPVADERFSRVLNMSDLHSSQPARSSWSKTSKPSPSAPLNHRGGSS